MRDFNHTVNVLVKAYLNNTLVHGSCAACAVGNIVADIYDTQPMPSVSSKNGFKFEKYINGREALWQNVFMTNYHTQKIHPESFIGQTKRQIEATGYTWEELARIESAFETAPRTCSIQEQRNEEWMFNGLMAVVDVLADIHEINLEAKEDAKLLFVKV